MSRLKDNKAFKKENKKRNKNNCQHEMGETPLARRRAAAPRTPRFFFMHSGSCFALFLSSPWKLSLLPSDRACCCDLESLVERSGARFKAPFRTVWLFQPLRVNSRDKKVYTPNLELR